jgi:Tol biopolymer transport system component
MSMKSKILQFLIIAVLLTSLAGCQSKLTKQAQQSDKTRPLTFFSQRMTAKGMDRLLMTGRNGDNLAYLADFSTPLPFYPISWSLDGNSFVATGIDEPAGITCLMLYKSADERQCLSGAATNAPKWSPNGRWITVSSDDSLSDKRVLELYEISTGQVTPLADLPDNKIASISTWSPDSTLIAYDTGVELTDKVWVKNLSGGPAMPLFVGHMPAWSPDGEEIAFVRAGKIWIFDVASKTEKVLIDDPVEATWPTWSPDGQQLLFMSNREGNWEAYRINHDGTGAQNISNDPAWDGFPSWRP